MKLNRYYELYLDGMPTGHVIYAGEAPKAPDPSRAWLPTAATQIDSEQSLGVAEREPIDEPIVEVIEALAGLALGVQLLDTRFIVTVRYGTADICRDIMCEQGWENRIFIIEAVEDPEETTH